MTQDLTNATVTLTVPKKYVEEGTVNIPDFITHSFIMKYSILPVTEDENNYYASISFEVYDKTQTLVLPFALSFKDEVVPDNYELPVMASVTYSDPSKSPEQAEPLIYKPLYKNWSIDKFVNSNKLDAFRTDGAEVVVTAKYEDGNPYLDDTYYVDFCFRINNIVSTNGNLDDFRDVSSVTLTDTLPRYEMWNGSTDNIAVFDPEVNEGWTLNKDGQTVSKTYTGENSMDVLLQVYNDAPLKLRFPGLKLVQNPKDKNHLIAELDNIVAMEAEPSSAAEGETRPEARDTLHFVITTDRGGKGSFTKRAEKGNIYDVMNYKTNPYAWKISLSNIGIQPLEYIQIQDRKIEGENGLGGLDEALKFVKLESVWEDSKPKTNQRFVNAIEKVIAYYTDGTQQDIPATINSSGNLTITFDSSKVCDGYDIIFKDDFQLLMNESVSFKAYTIYRDPEHTVIPEGMDKIRYANSARSENCYWQGDKLTHQYLYCTHSYDMLPVKEELKISKQTWYNSSTDNNKIGDKYQYFIFLAGSLLTSEQKEYGDIRIVDLLPEGIEYVRTTNGYNEYTDKDGNFGKADIIQNYHNSGRTAVIHHITHDALEKYWAWQKRATLSFEVKIRSDAHPGIVRNDVYVVGDNLDEYHNSIGGTEDIYDLNNNGQTDDMIAYAHSDATIIAAKSIYAEKFIAPADSNNWNKQGLALKAGSKLDYLLRITNEINEAQTGLIVYDTLPAIGDMNIFGGNGRNSEFPVHLRESIEPPDGYKVYYTTSQDVYKRPMNEMLSADIWVNYPENGDWSAVTAFKLVADEGTLLSSNTTFEVRVPACIPSILSKKSMDFLDKKEYEDQESGTMAYLEAINSFGFRTNEAAQLKESNPVWARIPFAGLTVKKIDSIIKVGLQGAEFELTKNDNYGGIDIFFPEQRAISDEDGFLEFHNLTEGRYTLTETQVPLGYIDNEVSLSMAIIQNPITMEYDVIFEDPYTEAGIGTSVHPLLIENEAHGDRLPDTGGNGAMKIYLGGILIVG